MPFSDHSHLSRYCLQFVQSIVSPRKIELVKAHGFTCLLFIQLLALNLSIFLNPLSPLFEWSLVLARITFFNNKWVCMSHENEIIVYSSFFLFLSSFPFPN